MTDAAQKSSVAQEDAVRWLFEGDMELVTPMHVGDGQFEGIDHGPAASGFACGDTIAAVARDRNGKPYIPGSSLKGALRAFAERAGFAESFVETVFGDDKEMATVAGAVEFLPAFLEGEVISSQLPQFNATTQTAVEAHVAIDRCTGSAEEHKLFQMSLIPPGTVFPFRAVCRQLTVEQSRELRQLLEDAVADPLFRLGRGGARNNGAIRWKGEVRVRCLARMDCLRWLQEFDDEAPVSWKSRATEVMHEVASRNHGVDRRVIVVPVTLEFHSPCLVKESPAKGAETSGAPDGVPRRNHLGKPIIPASSVHGRLRSQCERILNTVGCRVPQGHEAEGHAAGEPFKDLAALLFGSPGWRSPVQCSDFVAEGGHVAVQEMVSIDRIIGGGKKGAKFNLEYIECPTMVGCLTIDLDRLDAARFHEELARPAAVPVSATNAALGLLTLLLRDVAEGDVTFGYGRSKGYGQCLSAALLETWRDSLSKAGYDVDEVLSTARVAFAPIPDAGPHFDFAHQGDMPRLRVQAQPAGRNVFHNPYAFLPLEKPDTTNWIPWGSLPGSNHDQSKYSGLNGRIICRLETRTPLFIGAKQKAGSRGRGNEGGVSGVAEPYKLGGRNAIPATSLRGVLSTLHEAITGSNLRVMEDQPYSVRADFSSSLTAIGRLVRDGEKWFLEPLCAPTFSQSENGKWGFDRRWSKHFRGSQQKIYLAGHERGLLPGAVRYLEGILEAFVVDSMGQRYLIGKRVNNGVLHEDGAPDRVRGVVRSIVHRGRRLPSGVRHALFVPCDEKPKADRLTEVPQSVIDTFHALADEVLERQGSDGRVPEVELFPYVPLGRASGDRSRQCDFRTRLADGDLVYFDVDQYGRVSEVSFSSVWRHPVGGVGADGRRRGSALQFVEMVDSNLLPLGRSDRTALSPVELLFGVVQERRATAEAGEAKREAAMAYAGKVRIGIALPPQDHEPRVLDHVLLKELSSPKPPSPALYFHPADGTAKFVSKQTLSANPGSCRLNGRKVYLHAKRDPAMGSDGEGPVARMNRIGEVDDQGVPPWKSSFDGMDDEGNARRMRVTPIAAGESFYFEVDFSNLEEAELCSLLATLHPFPEFEHKLGLGKPIGLGSVKIGPVGLSFVNRIDRYCRQAVDGRRYATGWRREEEDSKRWPMHLQADPAVLGDELQVEVNPMELAKTGFNAVSPDVRKALLLLGDPRHVRSPVHYPQNAGMSIETENFRWFQGNERARVKQFLHTVGKDSDEIPTLSRDQEKARRRR